MIPFLHKAYETLIASASNLQSLFLLVIRVYWGWEFFLSGKGKFINHDKIAEIFQRLNLPLPDLLAWLAAGVECFGGLFLLLGLASRLVAIPLVFTMIVAYVAGDWEKIRNIVSDPDKFVTADPFLFLFTSLIVLIFGPGRVSVDYLLKCYFERATDLK